MFQATFLPSILLPLSGAPEEGPQVLKVTSAGVLAGTARGRHVGISSAHIQATHGHRRAEPRYTQKTQAVHHQLQVIAKLKQLIVYLTCALLDCLVHGLPLSFDALS